MLQINEKITVSRDFIKITFIRSRGPGGQNVNKVNTRAQLTFDMKGCPEVPVAAKKRLAVLAGRRLTKLGTIIIESDRFRRQKDNRREVLYRLRRLICRALVQPTPRRLTKPTAASKRKKQENKQHRSRVKSWRKKVSLDD